MIFHLILVLVVTTAVSSRIINQQVDLDGTTNSDTRYEITHIYWPRVQKRSLGDASSAHLKVFGKNIDLHLRPIDKVLVGDATPVFTMECNNGVPRIKKSSRNIAKLVRVYEDRKNRASISMTYDTKRRQRSITGFIELYNLTIHPVPDGTNCSIDNIPIEELEDHHCHLISKGKLPETHHKLVKREAQKLNIRKLPLPDIVYPEVLIIVDHNLYKIFNFNTEKIVPYLLSFWNAVDLKFRSFTSPRILLNIAGIILIQTNRIFPYMEPLKVEGDEDRDIKAVRKMGEWLKKYQSEIPVNYDIAVKMTTTELHIDGTTAGLAPQSGMCDKSSSVAMIRDLGGFHGILTTAHELGHSMGALHDEDHTKCNYSIPEYIMSEKTSSTPNAAWWSECSIEDIQKFLQTDPDAGCLYNKPKIGNPLELRLPGKMMSADEQCQKIAGGKLKKMGEDICHDMRCFDSTGNPHRNAVGAADGTPCAKGKICINSNCVPNR